MIVQTIFGTAALVTSIIGLMPQAYKALKTRSTQDVSMLMLWNFLICSFAWMVYGYCIDSMFVLFSNVVGLITCIVLILQKKYYDKIRH